MTFTRTETKEQRFLRLVREAISQGDKVTASVDSDKALKALHEAEHSAEADIQAKEQEADKAVQRYMNRNGQ